MLANVDKNIEKFEFDQYKEVFNSLQEGILVTHTEHVEGREEGNFKVFFANEIMQEMMFKLLDTPIEDRKD